MTPTNHNASKVLLGSTGSNERDVSCELGDPEVCKAGYAVKKGSDANVALGGAAGSFLGVSLGRSNSDTKKVAVARCGLRIPMRLQDDNVFASLEQGDLTFTALERGAAGNSITIALVDGGDAGDETVEVVGSDIVVNMEDGVSTAQNIADALEASAEAMALISVAIADGEETSAQDAFAEDNLAGGTDAFAWVVIGDPVEVDGDTGEACEDDEATGAIYASGVLTGVDAITKEESYAVLVDMVGGL